MEEKFLLANILGGINSYIRDYISDEDAFMEWINYFPDLCSEDELMEIVEDRELATYLIKLGSRIIYLYKE